MEIAIPAIALGALYIISNQEKCKAYLFVWLIPSKKNINLNFYVYLIFVSVNE